MPDGRARAFFDAIVERIKAERIFGLGLLPAFIIPTPVT